MKSAFATLLLAGCSVAACSSAAAPASDHPGDGGAFAVDAAADVSSSDGAVVVDARVDANDAPDASDAAAAPDAPAEAACFPACPTNGCGSDGCGGSCGTCTGESACVNGICVAPSCAETCSTGKCGWDPYQKGGMGAYGCIPQEWTTRDCNGVGAFGVCDFSGAMQRCTSSGLMQQQCGGPGCGLDSSSSCGGNLTSCIQCNGTAAYCPGAASAPICQGDLSVECYDNSYTLVWCPDSGKTCQCPQGICACQ